MLTQQHLQSTWYRIGPNPRTTKEDQRRGYDPDTTDRVVEFVTVLQVVIRKQIVAIQVEL